MRHRFCLGALLILLLPIHGSAQSSASPNTALAAGLASTLVPTALGLGIWGSADRDRSAAGLVIASGVVFGPGVGYWSAGMSGRGWRTVGLRSGLFLVSFLPAMAICGWDCSAGDGEYDLAWALIATGAGFGAASAVYDLARMKRNVRQHQGRGVGIDIGLVPTYTVQTRAVGVLVSAAF